MKKIFLVILISICNFVVYAQPIEWGLYSIKSEAINDSITSLKLAEYLLNNAFSKKHTDLYWQNLDETWEAIQNSRDIFEIPIYDNNKIQWSKVFHNVDNDYSSENVTQIINVLKSIPVNSYSYNWSKKGFKTKFNINIPKTLIIKVGVIETNRGFKTNYITINRHTYSFSITGDLVICTEYTNQIGVKFMR